MKRALLIGINYIGTENALAGCINDITNISNVLTNRCGYNKNDVTVLTEKSSMHPTRQNIEDKIKALSLNCKSGDTLFFYYSGHGSEIADKSGDESDGKDGVLVPLDYTTKGVITDDWLFTNLAAVLPVGVTLWAFTDCCHSGTMFDLQYNFECRSAYKNGAIRKNIEYVPSQWSDQYNFSNEKNKLTTGDVYMFSGCLDPQTSADAFIRNQSQGAFTACLLEFIDKNSSKSADGSTKFNSGSKKIIDVLKEVNCRLIINGFDQRPQLSMGRVQDISKVFNI